MIDEAGRQTLARNVPGRSSRKRHWLRWILAGLGVLVVLVVLAVGAFIKLQPTLSPLVLPTAGASAPAGPLAGTWDVAAGSVAGFRVHETALGISNDTGRRTHAVTRTIASPGPRRQPVATFTLTQPVTLGSAFASGATITATATGQLTMRGISHLVTVTISGRRNGSALQVAGSIPIAFSDWGITGPKGYGFFGSLANHGVAEFLLVLHRH